MVDVGILTPPYLGSDLHAGGYRRLKIKRLLECRRGESAGPEVSVKRKPFASCKRKAFPRKGLGGFSIPLNWVRDQRAGHFKIFDTASRHILDKYNYIFFSECCRLFPLCFSKPGRRLGRSGCGADSRGEPPQVQFAKSPFHFALTHSAGRKAGFFDR
jgi:hypothetical protein